MDDPSVLEYVLLFGVLPAAVLLVIVLLVMGPGWTRAGAYRPGESWNYEPIMIGANASGDVSRAISAGAATDLGALEPALPGNALRNPEGGSSARW